MVHKGLPMCLLTQLVTTTLWDIGEEDIIFPWGKQGHIVSNGQAWTINSDFSDEPSPWRHDLGGKAVAVGIRILASRMSGSVHVRYLDAGPPLTGCVALGKSLLFPRSCSVVHWKIRRWMTCLGRFIPAATGCSSLGFCGSRRFPRLHSRVFLVIFALAVALW